MLLKYSPLVSKISLTKHTPTSSGNQLLYKNIFVWQWGNYD